MKNIIKLSLLVFTLCFSCKKQECTPVKEPLKKYYINDVFEMKYDEEVIVVDTSVLIEIDSFLTYNVKIRSIVEDKRTPEYVCGQTLGGFIYNDIEVKNNLTSVVKNDTLFYPSCTDNYISEFGAYYKPVYIDSSQLWLLQVTPQPIEIDDEDNAIIPINEYKFTLKLKNNE